MMEVIVRGLIQLSPDTKMGAADNEALMSPQSSFSHHYTLKEHNYIITALFESSEAPPWSPYLAEERQKQDERRAPLLAWRHAFGKR